MQIQFESETGIWRSQNEPLQADMREMEEARANQIAESSRERDRTFNEWISRRVRQSLERVREVAIRQQFEGVPRS